MTTERIDVRAELNDAADVFKDLANGTELTVDHARADAMKEVADAVAELIESDREYDEALRLSNIGYGTCDDDRSAQQRLRDAVTRRRAALARIEPQL